MSEDKKKEKRERYVTPKGVAIFPRLITPDTKFNADGRFSVKLRLTAEEAAPICKRLEAAADAEYKAKVKEYKGKKDKKGKEITVTKADTPWAVADDDSGDLIFSFGMPAKVKSKKTGKEYNFKPALFDAKGQPMARKKGMDIWGGSEIKVSYEVRPYFVPKDYECGASLRLEGVQILKLVSGQGQDASSYGFGEEDGYEADKGDFADESEDDTDTDGEDSEDF